MNIFMAVLCGFCYIFLGYLAWHDHVEKFKSNNNKSKKVLHAVACILLYILIGVFLAALLYLILTM